MELVIYNDSFPPDKKSWSSPQIEDRGNWAWISEAIVNWFCYSHGMRKDLNLSIVIGEVQIRLIGSKLRYLAPTQRSVLSILYNAYKAHVMKKKKKYQPGIFIETFENLEQFEKPWFRLNLNNDNSGELFTHISQPGTLFINNPELHMKTLSVATVDYNQALIWLIYS